jgi:hypothetical protein
MKILDFRRNFLAEPSVENRVHGNSQLVFSKLLQYRMLNLVLNLVSYCILNLVATTRVRMLLPGTHATTIYTKFNI